MKAMIRLLVVVVLTLSLTGQLAHAGGYPPVIVPPVKTAAVAGGGGGSSAAGFVVGFVIGIALAILIHEAQHMHGKTCARNNQEARLWLPLCKTKKKIVFSK